MTDTNAPTMDLTAALAPDRLTAWLEYEFATHAARATELRAAYERFLVATANGITTDETVGRATDFTRQIKVAAKDTDDTRTRIKAPVLHAQRMIDGTAKKINDSLTAAATVVEQRITIYLRAKEAETRAAAEKEAMRRDQEAQDAMLAAQALNTAAADQAAVDAYEAAQHAIAEAQASTVEMSRTRSQHGGLAGLRDNWTFAIEDEDKVPAGYLMVNEAAVKAAIKAGTRDIPGLRIFNDPRAYVR
jgi:hypothetical protein